MQNKPVSTMLACATAGVLALAMSANHRAMAGPPLVCHPIEIEEGAQTLPFGDNPFEIDKGYDVKNLVSDTLTYLDGDAPLLTRMETLRRAAIYARETKQEGKAMRLLAELEGRVIDAIVAGQEGEHAFFDAGYFAQICKQYSILPYDQKSIDGYAWVQHVAELEPKSAELQFALALISAYPERGDKDSHLKRAVEGTSAGTTLAKNLELHFDASFSELQDRFARR